jgi:hypothetical protein
LKGVAIVGQGVMLNTKNGGGTPKYKIIGYHMLSELSPHMVDEATKSVLVMKKSFDGS